MENQWVNGTWCTTELLVFRLWVWTSYIKHLYQTLNETTDWHANGTDSGLQSDMGLYCLRRHSCFYMVFSSIKYHESLIIYKQSNMLMFSVLPCPVLGQLCWFQLLPCLQTLHSCIRFHPTDNGISGAKKQRKVTLSMHSIWVGISVTLFCTFSGKASLCYTCPC